jgi:hypothetical protein
VLYQQVNIITEDCFHHAKEDLIDVDSVHLKSIKVRKAGTIRYFYNYISNHFNIPLSKFRLWNFQKRDNATWRPWKTIVPIDNEQDEKESQLDDQKIRDYTGVMFERTMREVKSNKNRVFHYHDHNTPGLNVWLEILPSINDGIDPITSLPMDAGYVQDSILKRNYGVENCLENMEVNSRENGRHSSSSSTSSGDIQDDSVDVDNYHMLVKTNPHRHEMEFGHVKVNCGPQLESECTSKSEYLPLSTIPSKTYFYLHSSLKSFQNYRLIFIKKYDKLSNQLSYVGHIILQKTEPVAAVIQSFLIKTKLPRNTICKLYEDFNRRSPANDLLEIGLITNPETDPVLQKN